LETRLETRLNAMASKTQLLSTDGELIDHSKWTFGPISKGRYTTNAFMNERAGTRQNPSFQIHYRMRVKHIPSPGENKTIASHPYERVNLECAVPREWADMHQWFRSVDNTHGIQMTFKNQSTVWSTKRPKALEELVPEELYRPSIQDGVDKKTGKTWLELGWDPALRLKLIPPEKMKDEVVIPNKRPTQVYVVQGKDVRKGVIADIEQNDEIVASVNVEGWWASKDGSGITYTVDEVAVYKPRERPNTCQLLLPDMDTSSDSPPANKRARQEPGAEAAALAAASSDGSSGGDGSSDALEGGGDGSSNTVTDMGDDGAISEEEGF